MCFELGLEFILKLDILVVLEGSHRLDYSLSISLFELSCFVLFSWKSIWTRSLPSSNPVKSRAFSRIGLDSLQKSLEPLRVFYLKNRPFKLVFQIWRRRYLYASFAVILSLFLHFGTQQATSILMKINQRLI